MQGQRNATVAARRYESGANHFQFWTCVVGRLFRYHRMEEKDSQTIGTWNAGSGVGDACGTLLFPPSGDAKGTAYEQPASCQDFIFFLSRAEQRVTTVAHAWCSGRISYRRKRPAVVVRQRDHHEHPGRPISYAILPTTSRQAHPRRVPADLLSTRNHLLAPSIVPGKKSAANTEQISRYHYQHSQLITYQAPCTGIPAHECYRVPIPVSNSASSLEIHAGNMYIYNTTHTRTCIDTVGTTACRNYAPGRCVEEASLV